MKVSLCGPHSLETSTLLPTVREDVTLPPCEAPFAARYWYVAHQVGLCVDLFCAEAPTQTNKQNTALTNILGERVIGTPIGIVAGRSFLLRAGGRVKRIRDLCSQISRIAVISGLALLAVSA